MAAIQRCKKFVRRQLIAKLIGGHLQRVSVYQERCSGISQRIEDAGEFKLSLCLADAIEVQVRKPHAARSIVQ